MFERIIYQDQDHLLECVAVSQNFHLWRHIQRNRTHGVKLPGLPTNFFQYRCQVQRLMGQVPPGIGARQHQQIVHQTDHPVAFVNHISQNVDLLFCRNGRRAPQQSQVAPQRGQRGA